MEKGQTQRKRNWVRQAASLRASRKNVNNVVLNNKNYNTYKTFSASAAAAAERSRPRA
jgi:hypothetical protein